MWFLVVIGVLYTILIYHNLLSEMLMCWRSFFAQRALEVLQRGRWLGYRRLYASFNESFESVVGAKVGTGEHSGWNWEWLPCRHCFGNKCSIWMQHPGGLLGADEKCLTLVSLLPFRTRTEPPSLTFLSQIITLSFQRALFHYQNPTQWYVCDFNDVLLRIRNALKNSECGLDNIFAKQERTRLTWKTHICTRVYLVHNERTQTTKVVKCWMP